MNEPVIYVDPIQQYGTGLWCHMWTDGTPEQLDAFARRIGLKGTWAQYGGMRGDFYHYDLKPSKRQLALDNGAVELPLREWIKRRMEEKHV